MLTDHRPDARQEALDTFYHRTGACCAGCDWWRSWSVLVGECRASAIVPGSERADQLGIANVSCGMPSGHPFTPREHHCGAFKDEFDWTSLPLPYRKRVGELKPARRALTAETAEPSGAPPGGRGDA